MELSLREFKKKFFDDLLEVHWRHWTALGVASHVNPERYWAIDLEALILSTLTNGLYDKRLLSSSLEWLAKNSEWINISRLKRIIKTFTKPVPGLKKFLLAPEIIHLLVNASNKYSRNKIVLPEPNPAFTDDDVFESYKRTFEHFKIRGVVTKPRLQNPSLLQLLLRGIFGVDARSEILIYLLGNESGNSNAIAKEVFFNQRNVYSILERWAEAGMVIKIPEPRATRYSLNRGKELLNTVGLKEMPNYLNWTGTFLLLDQIAQGLVTSPWSEDEYLLSSFFRELLNEMKSLGKNLSVKVPEPNSYEGKRYFAPFARSILNILKQLRTRP